jgi:hypothetical protein
MVTPRTYNFHHHSLSYKPQNLQPFLFDIYRYTRRSGEKDKKKKNFFKKVLTTDCRGGKLFGRLSLRDSTERRKTTLQRSSKTNLGKSTQDT